MLQSPAVSSKRSSPWPSRLGLRDRTCWDVVRSGDRPRGTHPRPAGPERGTGRAARSQTGCLGAALRSRGGLVRESRHRSRTSSRAHRGRKRAHQCLGLHAATRLPGVRRGQRRCRRALLGRLQRSGLSCYSLRAPSIMAISRFSEVDPCMTTSPIRTQSSTLGVLVAPAFR